MQNRTISLIILPALLILLMAACDRGEEDILLLMPDNTRLIYENEFIRVLNVMLEPGQAQPLHMGGNRLIYALSEYTIRYTQPEDITEMNWNRGGVHWHEKGMHAVENIGETTVEYLVIERKDTDLPVVDSPHPDIDEALAETGLAMEMFENAHARVCRIAIPPGESTPAHVSPHRLVYSLSDYTIRFTSEETGVVENEFSEGDMHWHPAGMHTVENIGQTEAVYMVFSFLQ
jgi:quercetin dioxygenase-like cupin family protein